MSIAPDCPLNILLKIASFVLYNQDQEKAKEKKERDQEKMVALVAP